VRKFLSISLIALLMMNILGYYGVFMGLSFKNDSSMQTMLDLDAVESSKLIELKVPISVPYVSGSDSYERVDGKFEHEGQVYRLVKQKYFSDTLYILCIKDAKATRLNNALSDYVKTFTDHNSTNSPSKVSFSFIKDYLPQSIGLTISAPAVGEEVILNGTSKNFISSYFSSIIHPPERA
jgi:hypothetical protein